MCEAHSQLEVAKHQITISWLGILCLKVQCNTVEHFIKEAQQLASSAEFNPLEIRDYNAHQQFSAYSTVLLYSKSYSKSGMYSKSVMY